MGEHGVVDVLPATELRIQSVNVPAIGDHLIELLVMGAMRALDLRPFNFGERGGRTNRDRPRC